MSSEKEDDRDLDDILDNALDDFAKQLEDESVAVSSKTKNLTLSDSNNSHETRMSEELSGGLGLGLGLPSLPQKTPKSKKKSVKKIVSAERKFNAEAEERLTSTLEKLAEETRETVESIQPGDDKVDAELAESLLSQLEELGNSEDMQTLMETMMKQLLSKDVLYEPMKEISEKYPVWLKENKDKIKKEEYEKYSLQHSHIVKLCHVYESEPQDFDQIVSLMQKMQECGNPPTEIVKELAPELGEGTLPFSLPPEIGAGGMPENCSVM